MLQFTLPVDVLFEHLRQSANKLSQMCQSKSYIAPPRFNKKDDGWLVQLCWKSRLIGPCLKLDGSSPNCPFRSMCMRENDGASCDITASVPSIDHAHILTHTFNAKCFRNITLIYIRGLAEIIVPFKVYGRHSPNQVMLNRE